MKQPGRDETSTMKEELEKEQDVSEELLSSWTKISEVGCERGDTKREK